MDPSDDISGSTAPLDVGESAAETAYFGTGSVLTGAVLASEGHVTPSGAGAAIAHGSVPQAVEQVKRVFATVERDLVGFGPLLTQSVYALLTRENLIIFSPAGTAKTLYAGALFARIGGARVFDTQMSKGTLAEELFGSIDTELLKKGRIVHNTRGTLVDADFAFVDEFFDANDMVLRALLGVFNERVFKKGTQLEKSRLHTGFAAANYLRATEVTEAVLDRFLFRAYIAPDFSPASLLAVDRAFAGHYGRQSAMAPDEQIPLASLTLLADAVRGLLPEHAISAPPHVLFLKNAVLNRYRELLEETSDGTSRRPVYISPRTYAKTRLLLNASALLHGRCQITSEDLSQLKYAVTTIGGREEQARAFEQALKSVLLRLRGPDLEHIDSLWAARDLAEEVMDRYRNGHKIHPSGIVQRILRLFGLLSEGELTFDHVRRFVEGLHPADAQVRALKDGVLSRVQELSRRIDGRDGELFN